MTMVGLRNNAWIMSGPTVAPWCCPHRSLSSVLYRAFCNLTWRFLS